MTYRISIPENSNPLTHMSNEIGSRLLLNARQNLLDVIYDAEETTLTPREREGLRILFAARSGCPYCTAARMWRDKGGFSATEIEEPFYENAIALNLEWAGFNIRESLLLEFADCFDRDIDNLNGNDTLWQRMHANLSKTEIGDLLIMLGGWLGSSRAIKALGIAAAAHDIPQGQSIQDTIAGLVPGSRG